MVNKARLLVLALAGMLLFHVAGIVAEDKVPPAESSPPKRTLFVAMIENASGEDQYDPVAEGLSDLVSVFLAHQDAVTVVERWRLGDLTKEQALSLKGLTGRQYAVKAGKLLKADTVLAGRLYVVKNKLMVSAQVLEIKTARIVAASEFACRPETMMESALQMARALAKQMAAPLPEIDLKDIDKSPLAGLHFAKGLSHYYAGDMDAAIVQFMRTMDLDPDYVEAHYWSGMAYWRQEQWPHAVIEWEKLLKRRPNSLHAVKVKPLLAEAKKREAESPVEKLGPKEESAPDAQ